MLKRFIAALFILPMLFSVAGADDGLLNLIDTLATGKLKDRAAQIEAISKTGDVRAVPVLQALRDGSLFYRKSDKKVFLAEKSGSDFVLSDPLTGVEVETLSKSAVRKIKVNNRLRRQLAGVIGSMTLESSDPQIRLAAAQTIFKRGDGSALEALNAALGRETDANVIKAMELARAAAILNTDADTFDKVRAVELVGTQGGRTALPMLRELAAGGDKSIADAAQAQIAEIERAEALWNTAQTIWYGISLGSVLLLAAIGLAVTFGVMGVINMAHGEMVMLGAYTTFVVQEAIRASAPDLFDYSLLFALPLAFLVAGACGLAIERGVIRFLYGRPLETLLATWGISLILQQAIRTIFGPTNREVGNPSWMSGAYELGGLTLTANRLWIVVFAMVVFAALFLVLKKTAFGLQMRAVTQNRKMAASMGIRTPWVDAFTFALGSGIAGIAGVALSQIANVSPNLGQSYIIDSFMVVVFGGVGNLWGTLVGAMTLGIANKFLEPFAGAVLAKILILVLIILFIQKRPRGLFALKGRAVEA
ncbi:urea ABC transporter permease subunit UrtB [Hoeflea prorocentri]|uniref:Urea ABC transporter permease subunit UrtB n=1 Tax=Hoeflea prorocentri TaxID=1922333 RepID=A0A9X3ZFR5_9HYPH|nr:urea ABC transporter permease subunit UrtB [Hoeflea prorocentri]MCY6379152.1 urea ABC transporter permease subunit UrtB [Hoeflea prorocentri]MDA5396953.1 urea ABC transporter permease subunit UrtB [Hoeflea prorocentri]